MAFGFSVVASGTVWRRFVGALVLVLAEAAVALVLATTITAPTAAEQFDDRFPFLEDRQRHGGGNNNNGGFFSFPGEHPSTTRAAPAEYNSKAPPPSRKSDSAPLTSVVVLGDSMADWLAYGLEQAAADSPDIGILRRHRTYSGLIHIEVKSDPHGEYPDWPLAAHEILGADKANFIVMMIGLNDRRPIREKAPAKSTTPSATPTATPADKDGEKDGEKDNATNEAPPEAPARAAEAERATPGMVSYEFRSDKWTELYIKRIDETIAALKSKNVPVFWVGLPPVRNAKISADLSYLNDLFRARAEKAGITYIDTWDGFVDEAGRFVMQGPDFEGQIRRLRSPDGIHFTEAGARKLAHYVEREIQRALMANATPVTLPTTDEPATPQPAVPRPGAAIARPLAGPVMPLTTPAEANELAGGAGARQVAADAIASRVLVRGDPNRAPAGRADDFVWPRRPVAAVGTDPLVATTTIPMTPMKPYEPEPRQMASAPTAVGPNSPGAPVRRVAPVRQTASNPRPPTAAASPQQARRIAPAPQPFFFPFFGR